MRSVGLGKVVGFYGVVLGVALALLWRGQGLGAFIPAARPDAWLSSVGLGLVACFVVVGASRWATARFAWAKALQQGFRGQLGELSHRDVIVMALVSGIAEEALFRGVLQPALGLIVGALVFGAVHLGPDKRFLPWPWMATVAGLVLGGLFWGTGNLLAPIIAHVGINYLNLRWIALRPEQVELHLGPVGGEGAVGS